MQRKGAEWWRCLSNIVCGGIAMAVCGPSLSGCRFDMHAVIQKARAYGNVGAVTCMLACRQVWLVSTQQQIHSLAAVLGRAHRSQESSGSQEQDW